jgi:hypothetical protein
MTKEAQLAAVAGGNGGLAKNLRPAGALPPPDIPAGWELAPPDFVGVGAMRSGTSWWWTLLAAHSHVAVQDIMHKELHFFDRYACVETIDPAAYHRYFPRPPGHAAGEWTPRYMFDYWTPALLRQVAPGTKLLVLLRDPLERFRSALTFAESRNVPVSEFMLHQHFSRSLYGRQLLGLLRQFPAGQILVLQYERCVADPTGQLRLTLDFLGLDPAAWHAGDAASRRVNASGGTSHPKLDSATRAVLMPAFQNDMRPLFARFPTLDPGLWPSMAGLA